MKKIVAIIIVLVICVVVSFVFAYNTYVGEQRQLSNYNKEYETYYNKEILGHELATIINKVVNSNTKNNVEKDSQGNYISNENNSIKMDIYIMDSEKAYPVEKIYSLGTEKFVQNFDYETFKCTKIEYHEKTKKVKYIYFEQVTNSF